MPKDPYELNAWKRGREEKCFGDGVEGMWGRGDARGGGVGREGR